MALSLRLLFFMAALSAGVTIHGASCAGQCTKNHDASSAGHSLLQEKTKLHGKVVTELDTDKVEQDSIDEGIAAGLMKAFFNAEKTEKASQEDKNKLRAEFSKAVARVEASQIEQRSGAGMDDSSAALIVAVWWSWHRHLIVQSEPTQPPELIKYPYNPDFPIYNDNTTGNVTDNYTGNSTDGQERPSPGPQPGPVEDPYASDPPQGEKLEDDFTGEIRRLLNMLMG